MKVLTNLTLLLFVLLVIASCKKDDENANPDDKPDDTIATGDVTEERKLEIFGKVNSTMNELSWKDRKADYLKIETYLKSCQEFKEVGYSEEGDNVYAVFKDGTIYMVVNNRAKAEEFVDIDVQRQDNSNKRVGEFKMNAMPVSNKVYLFNALGTSFRSSRYSQNNINKLFKDKGYDVSLIDGTVKNLKDVKSVGVFYFATHGGFFNLNSKESVFGAWTSDSYEDNKGKYQQDLNEGNLIQISAFHNVGPDGKDQAATHLAITAKFVEKYMSFSPNALMYVDACLSFKEQSFQNAFLKQSDYTGTYLGWSDLVGDQDSYNNAAFFFDRMLAANFPYENYYPEAPDQRSFDLPSIMADITAKGLRKSVPYAATPNRIAKLEYRATEHKDIVLRPSISYLQMDELNDLLYIHGMFGDDLGETGREVTVDGVPVEVYAWQPILILCKIKNTGKGSAGDVVVKTWETKSHPRQLSEWRGTIKYKRPSEGSIMEEATINIHLRGDVGKYREAPGKKPVPVPQVSYTKSPAKDSKGTYSMGGSGAHNFTAACTYKNSVTWTDNNGTLPLLDMIGGHKPTDTYFTVTVTPLETGFTLENLGLNVATTSTSHMKSFFNCGEGEGENPIGPQLVRFGPLPEKFKKINLSFDSHFNITSGNDKDEQEGRAGLPYGGDMYGDPVQKFQLTLEWKFDAVKFPPKATDPK